MAVGTAPNASTPAPGAPHLLIVATVANTIAAFLLPYAAHFRSLGWRVDAAASGAPQDQRVVGAFDHAYDLPLSRSLRDVRGLWNASRAVHQILATDPDIVHVHTPIASFVTRYMNARRPPGRRSAAVYTAHGFHFHATGGLLPNAAFLMAERIAGRWTDRLIVINDEDEEAAARHRIVPGRRLVRMPGIGLDTATYSPAAVSARAASSARARLGIPAAAPLFVVVAELTARKRQQDAIAALGLLARTDAHLVLAGEGAKRPELEAQVRSAGLAERVHFLGVVVDVRPLVRAAAAVILPSGREGLARSVMEALSLEIPVIGSTARGNRELVGDDRGRIFETGDVHGLADAMTWLIDHPAAGVEMGRRGRARMVERYDIQVLVQMHEELYRGLLAERPAS